MSSGSADPQPGVTGAMSRRSALTSSAAAILGASVVGGSACSCGAPRHSGGAPAPSAPPLSPPVLPDAALITLGVVAGPPPHANMFGVSSALKIGDAVYVIDCGLGSLNAYVNAGLHVKDLTTMFITHLHTDHIVDYYSFFASGSFGAPPGRTPIAVYGPGPAGGLPPDEVGNPNPPTADPPPGSPTPGLLATTKALHQAFAYTNNIFIRDFGVGDFKDLVEVHEIAVPPGSDYLNRAPTMDPFPVMSDDNVAVTATLVSHYNVYPSFGFRFDMVTSGTSVTFSGDTTKSDNLIRLARSTDILVHESQFSLDAGFYHDKFPPNYLAASHTSAEQVGEVAAAAGAKHLVVSHYGPAGLPDSQWEEAIRKNYSGTITIARDGQVFPL